MRVISVIRTNNEQGYSNELYHHGVKGQKWGFRQYQDSGGSLTPLGRIHYGVGEARKGLSKAASSAKSGASKVGDSIRKKVKPTDEELSNRYDEALKKQARRKLKEDIRDAEGKTKHKKLKDMTDDEVLDYMHRLQNERSIRQMEKEANQGAISRIFEDYAKQGITRATNNVIDKAVENLFKEKEKVKYADVLKETEAKLKLDVLEGDKEAAKRLSDLRDATNTKGKGKDNNSNNSNNSNRESRAEGPSGTTVYEWDPDNQRQRARAARNTARDMNRNR